MQCRHGPTACSQSTFSRALTGTRQRSPGWAGGRRSNLPAVPRSLPTSSCKRSGTNLRPAFQDHSVRKVPHPKTSPDSPPACNLLQKKQAALQAAGQLCPPLNNPGAKPELPHSLHACPRLTTQLGQDLLTLLPSTFQTNPKLAEAVLGKHLTWLQKSSDAERAAGQPKSISELGASLGWVQGHKHRCRGGFREQLLAGCVGSSEGTSSCHSEVTAVSTPDPKQCCS